MYVPGTAMQQCLEYGYSGGYSDFLVGSLFLFIFTLIFHISEPQLHHCIEEIHGSNIYSDERFSSRISLPFRPFKMT